MGLEIGFYAFHLSFGLISNPRLDRHIHYKEQEDDNMDHATRFLMDKVEGKDSKKEKDIEAINFLMGSDQDYTDEIRASLEPTPVEQFLKLRRDGR